MNYHSCEVRPRIWERLHQVIMGEIFHVNSCLDALLTLCQTFSAFPYKHIHNEQDGRGGRTRTYGFLFPKQALYTTELHLDMEIMNAVFKTRSTSLAPIPIRLLPHKPLRRPYILCCGGGWIRTNIFTETSFSSPLNLSPSGYWSSNRSV